MIYIFNDNDYEERSYYVEIPDKYATKKVTDSILKQLRSTFENAFMVGRTQMIQWAPGVHSHGRYPIELHEMFTIWSDKDILCELPKDLLKEMLKAWELDRPDEFVILNAGLPWEERDSNPRKHWDKRFAEVKGWTE